MCVCRCVNLASAPLQCSRARRECRPLKLAHGLSAAVRDCCARRCATVSLDDREPRSGSSHRVLLTCLFALFLPRRACERRDEQPRRMRCVLFNARRASARLSECFMSARSNTRLGGTEPYLLTFGPQASPESRDPCCLLFAGRGSCVLRFAAAFAHRAREHSHAHIVT